MKKLIIFEIILIIFFVLAWNVSKAESLSKCIKMNSNTKIIEKTEILYQWSWKIDFENICSKNISGRPFFEFYDKDGFLIKKSNGKNIIIPSQGKTSFSDIELITVNLSKQITNYTSGIANLR